MKVASIKAYSFKTYDIKHVRYETCTVKSWYSNKWKKRQINSIILA